MKMGIQGINGRMGQAILRILLERGHTLGAAFDIASAPDFGRDAGDMLHMDQLGVTINAANSEEMALADGFIDFTSPAATMQFLGEAVKHKKPLVVGATGFGDEEIAALKEGSKEIPLVYSPNMSLGVNLLFKLTEIAAKALQNEYDVEIFEAHHKLKKDSPSGTAKRLIEAVKENVTELKDAVEMNGRAGMIGERGDCEIGVHAMRGGSIVGEHTVFFTGMEDRIELTHRAGSRDIFAKGAVLALEFLENKEPGFYTMYDVLGF
ncbi:MAG: 4-hydroxy-tetrahydrodipicolinate reductase [bacterium]|nr:4-hydroxy-tetrahydrodipicolinate reductase [bacterium]